MGNDLSIRKFNIREADWATEGKVLSNIRRLVFIVEQDVPQEEEWDGKDEGSWHWIATAHDDSPIGTARLLPEGQIGRMAVLDRYRGYGVGAALLEQAVDKARHLGFTEVFLNAQTHALAFYERAGFVAVGDEFQEAGIAHQKMTQVLKPFTDNIKRIQSSGSASSMTVKQFDTREISFEDFASVIKNIREIVFVAELGLPEIFVSDETDNNPESNTESNTDSNTDIEAIHWIAEDGPGQVIGSIRMSVEGEISRLAVMSENRHQGVGQSLVELATMRAARLGLTEVRLDALAALENFYRQAGFTKRGEPFDGFGQNHQTWFKTVDPEDVHGSPLGSGLAGDNYADATTKYKLGENKNLIILKREVEFRDIILEMISQASRSLRLYSPLLEHKLFDHPELGEICSALARKNRHTKIEILLYDSHRVVKNGHVLLELSRKLPSSIKMKIVDPEWRQFNNEYVLVDGTGVIYRRDYEMFNGYANFSDKTECERLGRQFKAAWETGLNDPDLRQIRI